MEPEVPPHRLYVGKYPRETDTPLVPDRTIPRPPRGFYRGTLLIPHVTKDFTSLHFSLLH